MEYKVISADDHIVEPRDLFVTRMPLEFRDQAQGHIDKIGAGVDPLAMNKIFAGNAARVFGLN